MRQVPFHHPVNAKSPTYKDGRLVHPGETIMVDMHESMQLAEPAAAPQTALGDLLKGTIKDIEPQLATMPRDQLVELLALEQKAETPRTTLLGKIEEAILVADTTNSQSGKPPLDVNGLRLDGPTIEEYVEAGYKAENYPPKGYAARLAPASDVFVELLKLPIKDIEPQLAAMPRDQLVELLALERKAEAPRTTLIGKIEDSILAIDTAPGA